MPLVCGAFKCSWDDERVSVLVVERVQHTLRSWTLSLTKLTPHPDDDALHILILLFAAFFTTVTNASDKEGFQLSDLHWDNIGVTAVTEAPKQASART